MQEWYKPVKGKTVSVDELNEVEQKNVKILDDEINRIVNELDMNHLMEKVKTII